MSNEQPQLGVFAQWDRPPDIFDATYDEVDE